MPDMGGKLTSIPAPWHACYAAGMRAGETKLEMVRRHVEEGAGHIEKQRALIAQLWAAGLPTEEAQALLGTFEAVQCQHEDDLARIMNKQR